MGPGSAPRVEILHVDRAHVEALAALIVAIEREAGGRSAEALASLGERVRRDLRASALSPDAPSILLAASVEGRLVAYASCAVVPKLDERRGFVFVDELHVLGPWRRRGIAARLVEAAAGEARARGLRGVRLLVRPDNDAARSLYRATGFAESPTVLCERVV